MRVKDLVSTWGGHGGAKRDIEVAPICLNNITIRSGRYVYSLEFSYNDEHGVEHHVGPWGVCDYFTDGILSTVSIDISF